CFVNGLAYEGLTVGESLRQAKNFLLAYALLKEKRLGKDAKRTGANVRAAWAFSLWGDPTLRLPRPRKAPKAPPPLPQNPPPHPPGGVAGDAPGAGGVQAV